MQLIDTHCHIHDSDYKIDPIIAIDNAINNGVTKIICIGTDVKSSKLAINFVQNEPNAWATIGLHPHDAKLGRPAFEDLKAMIKSPKIVGVGECGLDYYYNYSDKKDQFKALEFQMQLALDNNLPMTFHVRDAFDDFWPIFDNFKGLRGVIHSFTDTTATLDQVLLRNLLVGLNGIMTFTKDQQQLQMAKAIPLNSLVLETDAPYLTPKPIRGTINEPKNIKLIAEYLADLRGEDLNSLCTATTLNASRLFGL